MSRAPHPMLTPLWRQADAAGAAVDSLRRAESAIDTLIDDVAAGGGLTELAEPARFDWITEPPGGEDAVSRALEKLRAGPPAAAAVTARGRGDTARPDHGPSTPNLTGSISNGAAKETASGAPRGMTPRLKARRAAAGVGRGSVIAPAFAAAIETAGHRVITGGGDANEARAIEKVLNGERPPVRALLSALGLPSDHPAPGAVPATPLAAVTARRLVPLLAQIDMARTASRPAAPRAEPGGVRGASPIPPPLEPGGSGFRRLAARFARPAADRAPLSGEATGGVGRDGLASPGAAADGPTGHGQYGAPVSSAFAPVTIERRLIQTPPEGRAPGTLAPVLHRGGPGAAPDAEVAEQLARILRREARRQGIADEGGAG